MNCFVIPVEDSREGIYTALSQAAQVFAWGGGIGYNFSSLRSKGSDVAGTGGHASGPLSFMELFDNTGEVIAQASRRGAQMGILNIEHPDIEAFINYKNVLNERNQRIYDDYIRNLDIAGLDRRRKGYFNIMYKTLADNQLTHFNISVAMSDNYMKKPDERLTMIAENAWKNGDPGIYFIDRANEDNLVPYLGSLDATNPCGEVPLLPYEPCCLGSINLAQFVEGDFVDFTYLKQVVRFAVRFLDNIQTLNETPVPEINEAAKKTRRLGLGVMGWADVLAEMGIPYDHEDAVTLARILAKTIQIEAWETSMDLAEEKGAFPAYKPRNINWKLIDDLDLKRRPVRNVAVTSIAPTGSIALIANVNSGIEPYFDHNYRRNITEGIGNVAKDSVEQNSISKEVKTAHDIHWKDHIRMQAAWQQHVDNAVSKTINMPNGVPVSSVESAYEMAWDMGCKGVTVYRDGSRTFQILERENDA
jgi:ribonucleoside-diphosphate reductase alpha chain